MLRHHTSSGHGSTEGLRLNGTPFPWFDRESYPHVLEVMVDHDLMPQSYDRWLRQAHRVLEKARREGQKPIRAHIDPDRFLAWCASNGWVPDSMARMTYAAHVARLSLLPDETGARRALPEGQPAGD
jgi:hypothetical protein